VIGGKRDPVIIFRILNYRIREKPGGLWGKEKTSTCFHMSGTRHNVLVREAGERRRNLKPKEKITRLQVKPQQPERVAQSIGGFRKSVGFLQR